MTERAATHRFEPSRRDVLRYLAYGTVGTALGSQLLACTSSDDAKRPAGGGATGDYKILVSLELAGGNDSWSTIVPFESGAYHDLRPTLALDADQVIDWGDGWGVNLELSDLERLGIAAIGGVGTENPDLSHFAMLERWWQGMPRGTTSMVDNTGFLGRLCDVLAEGDRFSGISLQSGPSPSLNSRSAPTTSIDDLTEVFLDRDPNVARMVGASLAKLTMPSDSPFAPTVDGLHRITWITDVIAGLAGPSTGYPDTLVGNRLAAASRLIRSETGARVLHVPVTEIDYDTHQDHGPIHKRLMGELNAALSRFLVDLDEAGFGDRVLVATTSEFGRRAEEHDGGLDHGAASTMLAFGPVNPGLHGEQSPIDKLDDQGNLLATVTFDRYLATLATWLDVDPAEVLGTDGSKAPEPISGFLAT